MRLGIAKEDYFDLAHSTFKKNYSDYIKVAIPQKKFFKALFKDKKNIDNKTLSLVFPDSRGKIFIDKYDNNENINIIIKEFF